MKSSRVFSLSVVFALLASSAEAQGPTLERVLGAFAELPGLTANFEEEKHIALLAVPVRSRGSLVYIPGRLLRRVESPTPSVALIEEGRLVMRAGDEREVIDFSNNPLVAAFAGSIRHVLAGDEAALRAAYELDFSAEGENWRLRLRPKNAQLRRFFSEMVLEGTVGTEVRLERMRILEVSGDETRTVFSEARVRLFTAAEISRTFRVP